MIVEYIRYQMPPNQVEAFIAAYGRASAYLSSTEGVRAYELACADDAPGHCTVRIEWEAISAHEEFSRGPLLRPFLDELGPYLPHIVEMRHYTPSPVVFRRQDEATGTTPSAPAKSADNDLMLASLRDGERSCDSP